jgi:hypothetical protein
VTFETLFGELPGDGVLPQVLSSRGVSFIMWVVWRAVREARG